MPRRHVDVAHPEMGEYPPAGKVWIEQSEYQGSPNKRLKLKWCAHYSYDGRPMTIPAGHDYTGDYPERVITAEDVWIGCSHMIYYYPDTDEWLGYIPGYRQPEDDRWFECGVPVWGF